MATLPYASSAVTVTLPGAPAAVGFGKPETESVFAVERVHRDVAEMPVTGPWVTSVSSRGRQLRGLGVVERDRRGVSVATPSVKVTGDG